MDDLLRQIAEIAPGLHTAGTFSRAALEAIANSARTRVIRHSAETGCGASTLLFSHLSAEHTVFALDGGSGSITNVRRSPLLRAGTVTFVEGPTQTTLPRHQFSEKLQLALIDGPHGYPFPDLEYYYLYPHLDTGALLILDDIHIRTVHHLFRFLKQDAMFELERVEGSTALFRRTGAPVFDPLGDGWWQQRYNSALLWRYTWRQRLAEMAPAWMRRRGASAPGSAEIRILAPEGNGTVAGTILLQGSALLPPEVTLWILARRKDVEGWWPQGGGAAKVDQSQWRVSVTLGTAEDAGREFEIAAVAVGRATHQAWTDWTARVGEEVAPHAPVQLPPREFVFGFAKRTVTRAQG